MWLKIKKLFLYGSMNLLVGSTIIGISLTIINIQSRDLKNAQTFLLADDRSPSKQTTSANYNFSRLFQSSNSKLGINDFNFQEWINNLDNPKYEISLTTEQKKELKQLSQAIKDYDIKFKYSPNFQSVQKLNSAIQQGVRGQKLIPNMLFQYGDNFYNFLNNLRSNNFPVDIPKNLEKYISNFDDVSEPFKKGVTINNQNNEKKETIMIPIGKSLSNYMFINKGLLAEILIILGKEDLVFGPKNDKKGSNFLFQSNATKQPGKFTKNDIPTIKKVKDVIKEENKKKLEGYTWSFEDKKDFVEQIVLSKRKDQYSIVKDKDKKEELNINKYRTFLTYTESDVKYYKNNEFLKRKNYVIPWGILNGENLKKIIDNDEDVKQIEEITEFKHVENIFKDVNKFSWFSTLLPKLYEFQRKFVDEFNKQYLSDSPELKDRESKLTSYWNKSENWDSWDSINNKIIEKIKLEGHSWFEKIYKTKNSKYEEFYSLGNDDITGSFYLQFSQLSTDEFFYTEKTADWLKDNDKNQFFLNLKPKQKQIIEKYLETIDCFKGLNAKNNLNSNWPSIWGGLNMRNFQRSGQAYNSDIFKKGRMLATLGSTAGIWSIYKDHMEDFNMVWIKPDMISQESEERVSLSGPGLAILEHNEKSLDEKWNNLNKIKNKLSLYFSKFVTSKNINKDINKRTNYFPIHTSNFEKDFNNKYLNNSSFASNEIIGQIKEKIKEKEFFWDFQLSSLGQEMRGIINFIFNDYYADNIEINDIGKQKRNTTINDFYASLKFKVQEKEKGSNSKIVIRED